MMAWLARAAAYFVPAWEIREEIAGGEPCFGIYRCHMGCAVLFERWATLRTAGLRLDELSGRVPSGSPVPADRIARAVAPDAPEEGASTPAGRVYRGARAREVLENEAYQWAFSTLKTEIIESWQKAPAQDPRGRETLWLSLKLLEKVQSNLTSRLETGKLARLELDHRAKVEKDAKAWMS